MWRRLLSGCPSRLGRLNPRIRHLVASGLNHPQAAWTASAGYIPTSNVSFSTSSTCAQVPPVTRGGRGSREMTTASQQPRSQPTERDTKGRSLLQHAAIQCDEAGVHMTTHPEDLTDQLAAALKFFEHRSASPFLYSAETYANHPYNESIPEVIVLGASNVGKSSFLNALIGMAGIARVGHRPGKTTTMNAYGIGPPLKHTPSTGAKAPSKLNHSLVVIDTPGYGYKSQSTWGETINKYLTSRKMLRGAVLLLSSEKKLLKQDKWILAALAESGTDTMVILTKADKGGKDWSAACKKFSEDIIAEIRRLEKTSGNTWTKDLGWKHQVHITAATTASPGRLGNGAGIGGARLALLELAGFNIGEEVKQKAENIAYEGDIVSFDDIEWKT